MIKASNLIDQFKYALSEHWGYIWGTKGILWTESRQKQKINYMVSKYGTSWEKNSEAKQDNYYSAAKNGSKWIGHYVADCSGLFAWAFEKLGGAIAHGSNSIYDKYCSRKGNLEAGKRKDGGVMQPGTAVFTNHSGDKTHIGLYVGNGKVIEASSTDAGVCTSNVTATKWKCWGELKDVSYDAGTPDEGEPPCTDPTDLPTIRRGSKGDFVRLLQSELEKRGYNLGPCGVDGDFGKATEAAVKLFQQDWGLKQDGIAGRETWKILLSSPAKQTTYRVTVRGLTAEAAQTLAAKYANATVEKE